MVVDTENFWYLYRNPCYRCFFPSSYCRKYHKIIPVIRLKYPFIVVIEEGKSRLWYLKNKWVVETVGEFLLFKQQKRDSVVHSFSYFYSIFCNFYGKSMAVVLYWFFFFSWHHLKNWLMLYQSLPLVV